MNKIILAIPKGRIYDELEPKLTKAGVRPEDDFFDEKSRKLRFTTALDYLDIIRVRAFDVATFVAKGGAQIGVVGLDVIKEFSYSELYAPVDLGIGKCRLVFAAPNGVDAKDALLNESHVRIATKYPNITKKFFAQKGIQAQCVHLNGAMEIAPSLGLAPFIVDLVSSGDTMRANALSEIETIMDIASKVIVNRVALKTMPDKINTLIRIFEKGD